MDYAAAVAHLSSLAPELAPAGSGPRRKFDLEHMRTLCAYLGHPERAFPSVLIAGTNGKGSTAATLASILTAAGYRTGLYTSPHLIEPTERIQSARPEMPSEYGSAAVHGADGPLRLRQIAPHDFAALYTQVDDACTALVAEDRLPVAPSFFERLTAMAFLYFAGGPERTGVEIAVLEVGLGGRLDATNVVEPCLTILTDIALDHQDYLGDTIAAIAREKCGILRAGVPLVTLSQHPEANQTIGEAAAALGLEGINAAPCLPPAERNGAREEHGLIPNRYQVPLEGSDGDGDKPGLLEVDSPLAGEHQRRNIALAIAAALTLRRADRGFSQDRNSEGHVLPVESEKRNTFGYNITNAALAQGIRATRWPGRLERIGDNLLLDVAHNPAGAWTLRAAIMQLPPALPRTLLFSCLRDKDLTEMARILFPLFDSAPDGDPQRRGDHIVLTPIASPRAAAVDDLLAAAHALGIPAHAAPHVAAALSQARRITPAGGTILATGSVYLVGEIRSLVLHESPVAVPH